MHLCRRQFVSVLTIISMLVMVFGIVVGSAQAVSPPNIVTYQGRVLDANGVPVSSSSLSMKFFLYTALTGGTCVWSNSSGTCHSNTPATTTARTVTLTNGLFSENLGDTAAGTPYSAIADSTFADNASIYLAVEIAGEALSPRKQLVAAPYALNAETLDGIDLSVIQLWEVGTSGSYEDDVAAIVGADAAFSSASGGVGDLKVADQLEVDGAGFFESMLTVTGDTRLIADLAVNGDDITSDGVLTITANTYTRIGDVSTPGDASTDDDLYVSGAFEVDGTAFFDGSVDFDGAVDLDSMLNVDGSATFTSTFSASAGQISFTPTQTVASSTGATWNGLTVPATTATITGSTGVTTATGFNLFNISQPTLSAASALTVTNAASLYIANAPTGGGVGPAAISNAYSLWVDAGASRFDGVVTAGSTIDVTGTATVGDLSCTDCIDFAELVDAMALDTSSSIAQDAAETFTLSNGGTGNTIVNLASTGDFTVQDNGTDYFSFNDDRSIDYSSNETTTDPFDFTVDSVTTANALDFSVDGLTTGRGLFLTSTSPSLTSADLAALATSGTYTATTTVTGNVMDLSRSLTISDADAGIISNLNVTSPVATITDNCASAGNDVCTTSGNVLLLTQSFSSSGNVLGISNAGTGDAINIAGAGTGTAIDIDATTYTTDIEMQNDLTIDNNDNNDLTIQENAVSLNIDFAEDAVGEIALSSTSDLNIISTSTNSDSLTIVGSGSGGGVTIIGGSGAADAGENGNDVALEAADDVIFDSGDDVTFGMADDVNVTLAATGNFVIDAAATDHTSTTGALDIDFDTVGGASFATTVVGMTIDAELIDDADATDFAAAGAIRLAHTGDDADVFYGLTISQMNTAADVGNTTALLLLGNFETSQTGDDVDAGILFDDSLFGGFTYGIDMSGATIDTAEMRLSQGQLIDGNDNNDIDITENSLTLNIDFGESNASMIAFGSLSALSFASAGGEVVVGAIDVANAGTRNTVIQAGNSLPDAGENGNDIAFEAEDDVILDSGDDVTFGMVDDVLMTLAASGNVVIDAASTDHTSTTGALDINVDAGNAVVDGVNIILTQANGAAAATEATALDILLDAEDADGSLIGINVANQAGVSPGAAGNYEALLRLVNTEGLASVVTDAILIQDIGSVDASIVDAIDVSDTEITNAINVGANTITGTSFFISGTTATIGFTDFGVNVDGQVDIQPDLAGDAIEIDMGGAADIQAIDIDAATFNSRSTAGLIQIVADMEADASGTLGITIDYEILEEAGAGNTANTHAAMDVLATMTSNDGDILYGIRVQNLGGTNGSGTEYGIYQSGTSWDFGLFVEDIVAVGLDGTASTTAVCSSLASATAPVSGTAYTLRDCSGSPIADYAEQYPVASGVSYGDIVVPGSKIVTTQDGQTIVQLVKSSRSYEGPVAGIISNNYGDFTSAGYNISESENPMPVALVGRVSVNVTNENGLIKVGDYLTTSSTPGYAMKATKVGRVIGMALADFGSSVGQVMVQVNNGWYLGEVIAHDGTSTVVTDKAVMAPLRPASVSEPAVESYGFALRGSAWDGAQAQAVEMMLKTNVTNTNNFRLSVRNTTDTEVAYITNTGTMQIAGGMVITGNFYPSDRGTAQTEKYIYYDGSSGAAGDFMRTNAKGWSTGSYDFAEMFPSDELLQAGEVVVFANSGQMVRRSMEANVARIAGIVSTRPGFLAGENTIGSHPIALVGRVPTRVTAANGEVKVGDPLTTSSKPGYAMKATDPGMVVGYALEPVVSGDTSIFVYVNVGYWGGETTSSVPGTNNQASGFASGTNVNYSALNMTGNIYVSGNEILSVGHIVGIGDVWSIDQDGTMRTEGLLKTVTRSYTDEKVETVAMTSPEVVITLTGTAKLLGGQSEVRFEDSAPSFNDVTAADAPLRVIVTPSGPVSLYVSEKDNNHFVVKQFAGESVDVEFDWMVTAYRKGYEPILSSVILSESSSSVILSEPQASEGSPVDPAPPVSPESTLVDSLTEDEGGVQAEQPSESLIETTQSESETTLGEEISSVQEDVAESGT